MPTTYYYGEDSVGDIDESRGLRAFSVTVLDPAGPLPRDMPPNIYVTDTPDPKAAALEMYFAVNTRPVNAAIWRWPAQHFSVPAQIVSDWHDPEIFLRATNKKLYKSHDVFIHFEEQNSHPLMQAWRKCRGLLKDEVPPYHVYSNLVRNIIGAPYTNGVPDSISSWRCRTVEIMEIFATEYGSKTCMLQLRPNDSRNHASAKLASHIDGAFEPDFKIHNDSASNNSLMFAGNLRAVWPHHGQSTFICHDGDIERDIQRDVYGSKYFFHRGNARFYAAPEKSVCLLTGAYTDQENHKQHAVHASPVNRPDTDFRRLLWDTTFNVSPARIRALFRDGAYSEFMNSLRNDPLNAHIAPHLEV